MTEGEQDIIIEFAANSVTGRDAAMCVLMSTGSRAFREAPEVFSSPWVYFRMEEPTIGLSFLSNVSPLDRISRVTGLGDDGSSVGLHASWLPRCPQNERLPVQGGNSYGEHKTACSIDFQKNLWPG